MISQALIDVISEHASGTDENGTFPEKAFSGMATEGLLKITLPGEPLDFYKPDTATLLQLLKQTGSADLSVGRIYEGHINALYLVHLYATEEQRQHLYADVRKRSALFGVWNTQAGDGIRIQKKQDGHYTIEGCKTFCSGSGFIDYPLITGELEDDGVKGWQMCIIPRDKVKAIQPDAGFWQPMGMKASVSYRMNFANIRIEAKDLLGKPGEYYNQPTFSGGAIRFAAVQLGAAEALLNATKEYLVDLQRTGDPFQKARVAEMTWLITSGNQWLNTAGHNTDLWLSDGIKSAGIVAYANMTRTAIEEICLRTLQLAERCVGARGMMRPNRIERIHRDLTFYLRQPAPDASLTAIADYLFTQKTNANDLWR